MMNKFVPIGPTGKDIFAIAIYSRYRDRIRLTSAMIEALSKNEALGIAHGMAKNLKGDVMINVQSVFGPFDAEKMEVRDYDELAK